MCFQCSYRDHRHRRHRKKGIWQLYDSEEEYEFQLVRLVGRQSRRVRSVELGCLVLNEGKVTVAQYVRSVGVCVSSSSIVDDFGNDCIEFAGEFECEVASFLSR